MSRISIWRQPATTTDNHYLIILRWCPLIQDYIVVDGCMDCPYAETTCSLEKRRRLLKNE